MLGVTPPVCKVRSHESLIALWIQQEMTLDDNDAPSEGRRYLTARWCSDQAQRWAQRVRKPSMLKQHGDTACHLLPARGSYLVTARHPTQLSRGCRLALTTQSFISPAHNQLGGSPLRSPLLQHPQHESSANVLPSNKASAFSIRTHGECGSALGTFWSHWFSLHVMNPSNHVPIKMRNQKWLWQHSSPSNATIKGWDFLKSKFTGQELINKACEFRSGKGICSSHCALMMLYCLLRTTHPFLNQYSSLILFSYHSIDSCWHVRLLLIHWPRFTQGTTSELCASLNALHTFHHRASLTTGRLPLSITTEAYSAYFRRCEIGQPYSCITPTSFVAAHTLTLPKGKEKWEMSLAKGGGEMHWEMCNFHSRKSRRGGQFF